MSSEPRPTETQQPPQRQSGDDSPAPGRLLSALLSLSGDPPVALAAIAIIAVVALALVALELARHQ